MTNSGRLWLVSEVYYPQESATGYYMTGLAEGLAHHFSVGVLCARPAYSARGAAVASRERHGGVQIERCPGTTFNKDVVILRLANLVTISASVSLRAARTMRKQDVALVVTNPPLLPFAVAAACRLRGAKCALRVDDVYPEVMVATGLLSPGGIVTRILARMTRHLYRNVDHIVVLGRDMEDLVRRKLAGSSTQLTVIPNWADVDLVSPAPKAETALARELGLTGKFLVQCAGNMGRAQGIETVFKAAEILKDDAQVHFLFVGTGAKRPWMEREVEDKRLHNVTLVDQRPRADQGNFLNACDIAVVPVIPGMTGAGVPSRMYNVMAAGKPIVAVADPDSELSLVVHEECVGWVVPPDQPAGIVQAIQDARSSPERLVQMGARARAAAEARYSPRRIIGAYHDLIQGLFASSASAPATHQRKASVPRLR